MAYEQVSGELLAAVGERMTAGAEYEGIRLHGDFHAGNVLWSDAGPTFVDLDDSRTGPAIQDLWMMLSGEPDEMRGQLGDLLEGYEAFRPMDRREIPLIEALRALRLVHYASWLAARWDDPAFPRSFPWFATSAYWAEHVSALRQQIAAVREPPVDPFGL